VKITNIKLIDEKFVAEVELTQKQLDYITSVGIGTLLQAGASMIAFEMSSGEIFEQEEKDVTADIPSPAGTQE